MTRLVAAQSPDPAATVYVEGDRPGVIAFLPAAMRQSADAADVEAGLRVTQAVDVAQSCLSGSAISIQQVFADRIIVRRAGMDDETFEVGGTFVPLTGALLLRPGANSRIVFAGGGPQALVGLLARTAGEYFEVPCSPG